MTSTEQIQKWVADYLSIVPAGVLRDEAREFFSPELLRRCHSRSRKTFAQWVRLNLARDPEKAGLLAYMQEHKLPADILMQKCKDAGEGFKYTLSHDGSTALIEVIGEHHAIWKVPTEHLDWALGQYPVQLRRRTDVAESEFEFQLRQTQRQYAAAVKYGRKQLVAALTRDVTDLEQKIERQRRRTPLPRFMLFKSVDGRESALHRIYFHNFVDATLRDGDPVTAIDGDYLNFAWSQSPVVIEDLPSGGVLVRESRPGENPGLVRNLIVMKDPDTQQRFEESLLQVLENARGEPITAPLQIQPNANLGGETTVWGEVKRVTGVCGSGGERE